MAKSLVHKYTFNPAANTIVIDYIYKPERFLIITNVTTNQTIFLFNDQDLGIDSISYNYGQEKTTLVLNYDCSAMSSTDKLQIFIESDQQQFEPSPTLLDPVSKFRVSQPENLIDTDFEYGLQSTKWETLEMVKNIPTFFSRTGDSELNVVSITTVNGSDSVTVETGEAHSFATGTPVILIGTRNITCDGTFVVTVVVNETTFQYKAKAIQNFTGSILADYTQVFPGQVYQGTEFDLSGIDAINTDESLESLLTVRTEFPTLFEPGTSFFLSNSVGQVNTFFDATQVESSNFNAVSISRVNNAATGESGFTVGSVQPYVYTGPTVLYFRNSEVTINATTGIESITFSENHGFTDNQFWMYVPGEGNAVIGGLTAYLAYVVRVISPNAIYLTTALGSTTRVNLTGGGADGGVMRSAFIRAYRMTAVNTTSEVITFGENHGIASNTNQPVLFFPAGGTASNLATSTSLHTPGQLYYTRTTTANTTTVSITPNGANFNLTSTTATGIMVPVVNLPDANTLYFPSHNLSNNTSVVFTVISGTAPGGLVSTTTYKVEPVGNDRIRFKNNDTQAVINLTNIGTNISEYQIETRTPIINNDSIFAPLHVLRDGLEVTYTNEGGTTIPGLTDGGIYYVFQRTQNNFKLADNVAGWKTPLRDIVQSTGVNVTTNVITTTVAHGFSTGDAVQYLSPTPVGGLINGAFYWVRSVAATTCTLHWSKAGAIANNDFVDLELPVNGNGTLRGSFLVDITGTGTGTQKFKAVTSSASDGVYTLQNQIDSRTFQLSSNNQIPERELILGDSRTFLDLSRNMFRISDHSLKTGTLVRYETSSTAISGLTNETEYYVISTNRNTFKLAATSADAQSQTAIELTALGSGTHYLYTTSISGETSGAGTVSIEVDTDKVIGNATNFTATFAPGDRFIIFGAETLTNKSVSSINTTSDVLTSAGHAMPDGSAVIMFATTAPTGTTNGFIYYTRSTGLGTPANEFTLHPTYNDSLNNTNKIDLTTAGTTVVVRFIEDTGSTLNTTIKYVNSTTELILTAPVATAFSGVSFGVGTALFVRADGFALHRPYDGGVELIPSTNPDATIIRQTRKYFRYQSGKGIQVSFAVNFSPSITFETLTVSLDQDKIDKCERDVGYFIDGAALDLALETNYNARFLGIAETNSIDISPVVIAAIEDAQDAIKALTEVTSDLDEIVDDYFEEVFNIIENGREAASALTLTNPTGGDLNRIAAKDKILANKDFLIAEVNAYVEETFAPTDHDVSKCSRDLKYAIEGFAYDILYEGNQATYDGAKFFLYSYASGAFGIIPSHIEQTVAAYERLRDIISDVVTGTLITPSTGNTETQVTSGDNATVTEGEILEELAQIIVDTIDTQAVPGSVVRTLPDVTWASTEVQDAYTAINTNKATIIATAVTSDIGLTTATGTTRYPHRLTPGIEITVYGADLTGGIDRWNGVVKVTKIVDSYTFQYNLGGVPTDLQAGGLVEFYVNRWQNSKLKCGLFDDQNGLYFEYDGENLSCCRRSSVQQLSGTASVTFKSGEIIGNNTRFSSQLNRNDRIVIKGQTYIVTEIVNNTLMYILPSYRGVDNDNVIVTRTVDTKIPQSDWSVDRCDGTGPSGFVLNLNKIQMAYMDYSWYGAGKVRFGFKDQDGEVVYVHEFIHNNKFTEAYMRSGNLPGRYEVENVGRPTYVPSLAHWGTSVIMDGRFDDDKAYVFTASSNTLSISGSASLTVSARVESLNQYSVFANNIYRNAGNALLIATPSSAFNNIPANVVVSGAGIPVGTRTRLPGDGQISPRQPYLPSVLSRTFGQADGTRSLLLIDRAPTVTAGSASSYTVTLSGLATPVVYDQPLISIRLAPSVDTGTPGALGQREIINRMQLILDAVGILTTHGAEIILKLNGQLNSNNWQRVTNPSLSQLIYHSTADTIIGGTTVYSFRAQGGTGATARTPVITTADLGDIATLGNSIMGGDGTYPDGPDVITVVARLLEDPSTVGTTNTFSITGRISWSESQA